MLTTLLTYWPIVVSIGTLSLASIKLYLKIHDAVRDINALKIKQTADISDLKSEQCNHINSIKAGTSAACADTAAGGWNS